MSRKNQFLAQYGDSEHLDNLDSESLTNNFNIGMAATKNPLLKSHHIDKLIRAWDAQVRGGAVNHPSATEHHISLGMSDTADRVREKAISNRNVTSDHIMKALDDPFPRVRREAMSHTGKLTREHIDKAFNDPDGGIKQHWQHIH